MADVDRGPSPEPGASLERSGSDRAQLILVTGVVIATVFLLTVLILNTVIYSENLATRSIDKGGSDAIDVRNQVEVESGVLLDGENWQNHNASGNHSDVSDSVNRTLDRYGEHQHEHYVADATILEVDVDHSETEYGYVIVQDDPSRQFVSDSVTDDGTKDSLNDTFGSINLLEDRFSEWVVANNVTSTRNYTFVVHEWPTESTPADGFTVRFVDDSGEWTVHMYDDGTPKLNVTAPSGDTSIYEVNASDPVRIDLTAGTMEGESLEGYTFAEGIDGEYVVFYENGDAARGTYNLTVDGSEDEFSSIDPFFTPSGGDPTNESSSPYYMYAVYSLDVDVHYQNQEVEYRDTVRVAPGESDED